MLAKHVAQVITCVHIGHHITSDSFNQLGYATI